MASATPGEPAGPDARPPAGRRALVAVALLAVLVACLCGALVYGEVALSSPEATARGFMDALQRHDYQAAYAYLSTTARAHWATAGAEGASLNFSRYAASLDTAYGDIQGYTVGPARVQGTTATLDVAVRRPRAHFEEDQLTLSRQGTGWAIDAYTPRVGRRLPARASAAT
jgi:hypothetical protein